MPVLMLVAEADELVDATAAIGDRGASCPMRELVRFGAEVGARDPARGRSGARPRARPRSTRFLDARAPRAMSRTTSPSSARASPGASLAAELAPHARVLLLEAEDQPGLSRDRALGGVLVGNLWRAG